MPTFTYTLTANGNTNVPVPRGNSYTVAGSGTIDGTLKAQYSTAAPTAAALTTSLTGTNNDLVFTAREGGTAGNAITLEYVAAPNNPVLSVDCTNGAIVVNLVTADDTKAALTTALTGSDNDLTFEAVTPGTGGNSITVTYTDPSANDEALAVSVTDSDIEVTLGTNGSGTIISTAHQVKLALEAKAEAAALINVYFPTTAAASATLTTSLTGTNNDLVFTAASSGTFGNRVRVAYLDPGANDATLSVAVVGDTSFETINVSLATNGSGTITSTAAQVQAAIEAHADASGLVTIAAAGGNDGSGVVTALAATALSGGAAAFLQAGSGVVTAMAQDSLEGATDGEDTITTTAAQVATAIAANPGANALVSVANASSNDGTGAVTVLAETALSSGDNGTFAEYESGETGDLTAAGEVVLINTGASDWINLNLSGVTTTDFDVVVTDLGKA